MGVAGAVLAAVLREIMPSRRGCADAATAAFLAGFAPPVVVDAVIST